MADADGDSQMRSSSSDNESESLFPSGNSQQSLRGGGNGLNDTSELSPPLSQEAASQAGAEPMDMGNGQTQGAGSIGNRMNVGNMFSREPQAANEPGYSWMNSKARDEYARASNDVLDKNFSLKAFGDPFDETQMPSNTWKS